MKLWMKDLLLNISKFTQRIFDIYLQSKDMADSHNLQGRQEPLTLISFIYQLSTFLDPIFGGPS